MSIVFALVLLIVYFMPWIVAMSRNHKNTAAVFVVYLFLGWTLIGWVVALVWSMLHGQSKAITTPPLTCGHGAPTSERPADDWSAGGLTHAARQGK
jgi:hypothetical protein